MSTPLKISLRQTGYKYKRGQSLQVARIANLGVPNSRLPPPPFRFESFSGTVREIVFNRPQGLHEKLPQSRFPKGKNRTGGVQYVSAFYANLGYCSAPTRTRREAENQKGWKYNDERLVYTRMEVFSGIQKLLIYF